MKSWAYWGMTIPLLVALSAALIYGNAEKAHKRLLWLGEEVFGGYFQLQQDPVKPGNCDELFKEDHKQASSSDKGDDLDDLLDDDGSEEEGDDLDDLLGDDEEENETQKAQRMQAQAQARQKAKERCQAQQIAYTQITKRITPSVKIFRNIEGAISSFIAIVVNHFKHILVLILLFATFIASAKGEHIALRPAQSFLAHYISEFMQLLAFAMLGYSMWCRREILSSHEELTLNLLWLIGLTCIIMMHVYRMFQAQASTHKELHHQDHFFEALLAVPLFAVMAIVSGIYFYGFAHHPSGMAIELTKLTEHAILYVHVALYVWVGMLLKQSPLAAMFFDLLRPWKFEPALLAGLVVVAAAIPTAYSGASGIFVIAAGALIYEELRKAGARRQLALAATAMSGSLGVVLSPCLLIVIIASLNKQVTTDQLYTWGFKVFCLTAFLFLMICLLQRDKSQPWMGADRKVASTESKKALIVLLTPILYSIVLLVFYWLVLDTYLDEHSAPMVLPVLLILLLWITRKMDQQPTVKKAIIEATAESGPHIGALLSLMGLSICLGGVVERAELMSLFPTYFGSLWTTMTALVVILVLIGMSMDPYGAVILVSATIANVAYTNGIDPVHFWVVVMVAFELGYLSPPVALNHLLTRQVVGEEEFLAAKSESDNFFDKHERLILPMIVMGIALLLVAFTPLFFYKTVPEVSCATYCEKQIACAAEQVQATADEKSKASNHLSDCVQLCQQKEDQVLRVCATKDSCDDWKECHQLTPTQ